VCQNNLFGLGILFASLGACLARGPPSSAGEADDNKGVGGETVVGLTFRVLQGRDEPRRRFRVSKLIHPPPFYIEFPLGDYFSRQLCLLALSLVLAAALFAHLIISSAIN